MKTICVSGTPGTGKSTIAKKLAEKLGLTYCNVTKVIKDNKLREFYDKERDCEVVDVKRLNKELLKLAKKEKKGLVIDSHLSHYLPSKNVDACIITKCNLEELRRRLKERGYSKEKIAENIQAEIFDICNNEAQEYGHNVLIIDTTKSINITNIVKKL